MEPVRKRQFTFSTTYLLLALLVLWIVQGIVLRQERARPVSYSEMLRAVREGRVQRAQIGTNTILAELKPAAPAARDSTARGATPPRRPSLRGLFGAEGAPRGQLIETSRIPGVEETELLKTLDAAGVDYSGRIDQPSFISTLLFSWVLPFLLIMGLYWLVMQRIGRRAGPLSIGRSQAKIFDRNAAERVTFADVAGVDEAKAELIEVVSFLKDPSKYRALGARIPKGVLLVGPPGTGKTLLARAVAGEAGVPFFSLSGSEFVEMFVGVGAARMRSLFEQARERSPCIVFIDELDAIGKSRAGVAALATHDEREQTLNQLLVEMDGFDPGKGVIIMAATNRPEVLDPALLRPGRFDRQVLVDRPTLDGRLEILKVHARKVKLGPDVRLDEVARRTVGMVGADLANVVNEAALAGGRRGAGAVSQADFEEAIDRMQLGLKKRGRVMSAEEKRRVAFHESGHALVALSVEHADPVHRVTIIPRSIGALGATLQLPTEDRYLVTRDELTDRICVMLGGRAAEELVFEDVSTGAHNDLERASETARQMVCRFGMSERLGTVTYGRPAGARYLSIPVELSEERNFSEETAQAIDAEVRAIMDAQHERARQILRARRAVLDRMAALLLERETLEREELETLLHDAGVAIRPKALADGDEPGVTVAPGEPAEARIAGTRDPGIGSRE